MKRLIISLVAFLAVGSASAATGDMARADGTRLHLNLPSGFVEANEFPGFIKAADKAMIIVSEMPSPYMELTRSFDARGIQRRELQLVKRELLEKDGLAAEILHVTQDVDGERYEKWIFITGDDAEGIVVTGSYPYELADRYRGPMRASLVNSFWDSAQILDHFDGLEFRIDDVPGLRVATRVSRNVVFTDNGRMPDRYYTGPLLLMGWTEDAAIDDKRGFAEQRFRNNSLLSEPHLNELKAVHVGGLNGFEAVGTGKHRHLGYSVASLVLVLYDDNGVFIARGYSDSPRAEKNFSLFRTIISSFRRQES